MIWTDEFKPKEFDDIIGYGEKVKHICENGLQHLLFVGRPGTGKSSSVNVIVKKLGLDYIKLNASDERGIDTIRGKLTNFAMTRSSNGKDKIIWLDEFDKLSPDAFDALRAFVEEYQNTTKFICTANYLYKVPDAIQSRFTIIDFDSLPMENIYYRLKSIVELKGINMSDDLLYDLIKLCKSDVRKCINKLQELHSYDREIVKGDIKPDTDIEDKIYSLLKQRNFPQARQELLNSSIKTEDFINSFHEYLVNLSIVEKQIAPDKTKDMIKAFFEAISVLKYSANDEIVVEYLLLRIMELL